MSERAAGNIYDLGYRNYEGERLGRPQIVFSLYLYSLRAAFGLGRRASAKIFPISLAILTLVPAVIQLGIGAIADGIEDVFKAEDYYGYVQTILALFCAAVAPEMVGRDQRNRTLSLYFSRAMTRFDYAVAKTAALTTAMLMLTVIPQLLLFVGNGMAGNDLDGYFQDEWEQLPAIIASAVLLSVMMAAISLAIASRTSRRAFATGGILGVFHLLWVIVESIVSGIQPGGLGNYTILLSPLHVMRGFTFWFFDASAGRDSAVWVADLNGAVYAGAAIAMAAIASWLVLQRYRTVPA